MTNRTIIEWCSSLWCHVGWHLWLERGAYRRICKYCPVVQIFVPEEGWVRDD